MSREKIRSFTVVAGTETPFEFHAQLWRFTDEGRLENKLRRWRYVDEYSKIGDDGSIEITVDGQIKILVWNANSGEVEYDKKVKPITAYQQWTFLPNVYNEWGMIKNSINNQFLTTHYRHKFTVLTVEKKV